MSVPAVLASSTSSSSRLDSLLTLPIVDDRADPSIVVTLCTALQTVLDSRICISSELAQSKWLTSRNGGHVRPIPLHIISPGCNALFSISTVHLLLWLAYGRRHGVLLSDQESSVYRAGIIRGHHYMAFGL